MNDARIFVALSGGVDSAVSATLLARAGHQVVGVYLKVWSPALEDVFGACPWEDDVAHGERVAAHLNIPFFVWDISREYEAHVVSYFVKEYAQGRTPNPDIMCNTRMKFGYFLDRALTEGADAIATGHYARLGICHPERSEGSPVPRFTLLAGTDPNKDQSYFLYRLTQDQLAHAIFPIGGYTKPQVRALARDFGLPNADRKDSQGVCFIGKIPVQRFLKMHIPVREGALVTTRGDVVGVHDGAQFVTIGQRHGIGSTGGGTPYFVVAKDVATNRVTVAAGDTAPELYRRDITIGDVHWTSGKPPALPLSCMARIRYRQPLAACVVTPPSASPGALHLNFQAPQRAPAPGQSVVFYDRDIVLGGGIIQ